jgi:hypothetical protein
VGETVRETYRIVVPGDLGPGSYRLVMQVVHRTGTVGAPATPDDPKLAELDGMLVLGAVEVR